MADDPYRAPTAVDEPGLSPGNACPACGAPVTFWTWLRQRLPTRFRCPSCKARYGNHMPHLPWIFLGIGLVTVATLSVGDQLGWGDWLLGLVLGAFCCALAPLLYAHQILNARFYELDSKPPTEDETQG